MHKKWKKVLRFWPFLLMYLHERKQNHHRKQRLDQPLHWPRNGRDSGWSNPRHESQARGWKKSKVILAPLPFSVIITPSKERTPWTSLAPLLNIPTSPKATLMLASKEPLAGLSKTTTAQAVTSAQSVASKLAFTWMFTPRNSRPSNNPCHSHLFSIE